MKSVAAVVLVLFLSLAMSGRGAGATQVPSPTCAEVGRGVAKYVGKPVSFIGEYRGGKVSMDLTGKSQTIQFWMCTDGQGKLPSTDEIGGFSFDDASVEKSDAYMKAKAGPFRVSGVVEKEDQMTLTINGNATIRTIPFLSKVKIDVQ